MNPRFAEIFGYTVEELTDISYRNIVLPEDLPLLENCERKRIEGQEEWGHYPFRGITKDGKLIYLEVYNSRTIYEGDPAIIGTLMEITGRKQAEEQLQKLNEELERRVENAPSNCRRHSRNICMRKSSRQSANYRPLLPMNSIILCRGHGHTQRPE